MALGCETSAVNGQVNGEQLNQEKNYSNGKNSQLWEYPWNTNEIRKFSANWTLAGDVGLLNFLQEFSHQIISRTHEIEKAVDDLVHKTKGASAKVNNVVNDFQMLSNSQFVENRVYDEEVEDPKEEDLRSLDIQKSKKQREAEMMPRIAAALELGLKVIEEAFDKINVEELSDSEEEEDRSSEGRIILEPKDPYENRPLPHIIGSEPFHEDDHAGLRDTQFEEFIEVSAEDDSVSLSAESEDDNEEIASEPIAYHENQLPQTKDLNDAHSGSESSDLFENEEEKKTEYISSTDSSEEAEVKKTKDKNSYVSVISEVKSLGIFNPGSDIAETPSSGRKQSNLEIEDDLFASSKENALDDEDDSPFRKKSGLFSTESTIFGSANEEKFLDEDLFEERGKAPVNEKTRNVTDNFVKNVEALSLFDDDDDENEEIFSTPSANMHSTSELSKTNENRAKSESRKTSPPSAISSSKNAISDTITKLKVPVRTVAGTNLFDDDSDIDALFSSPQEIKTSNTMEDDLFSTATYDAPSGDLKEDENKTKMQKSPKTGLHFSLFEDDESPKPEKKKKPELSLFEDSDDLFNPVTDLAPKISKPQKLPMLEDSESVPIRFAEQVDNKSSTQSPINKKSPTLEPSKSISGKSDKRDKYVNSSLGMSSKKLPNIEDSESISLSFDEPVDTSNTLNTISKDRVKIPGKRRKPTRKGRQAALQNTDALDDADVPIKDTKSFPSQAKLNNKDLLFKDVIDELLFPAVNASQVKSKETVSSKQNDMDNSLFESDLLDTIHDSSSNISETVKDTNHLFHSSGTSKKSLSSSITISSIKTNSSESLEGSTNLHPGELKQKYDLSNMLDMSSIDDDDLFAEPAFKGFKKSLETKHSIFKMDEDDDDDDDIFKVSSDDHIKSKFTVTKDSDDIFGDSTSDIFAELQKEKYEMFPSHSPKEDETDDIFGIPKKGAEK